MGLKNGYRMSRYSLAISFLLLHSVLTEVASSSDPSGPSTSNSSVYSPKGGSAAEEDEPQGPEAHEIPFSEHEDPKDLSTKSQYVAPGVWAKPGKGRNVSLDFIPRKLYAQVRGTHEIQRLPQSEALKSAETEEDRINAPRLREVVTNTKVNTVYTEEGFEDAAYDHEGHIRDGDYHEDFNRKLRERVRGKSKPGDSKVRVRVPKNPDVERFVKEGIEKLEEDVLEGAEEVEKLSEINLDVGQPGDDPDEGDDRVEESQKVTEISQPEVPVREKEQRKRKRKKRRKLEIPVAGDQPQGGIPSRKELPGGGSLPEPGKLIQRRRMKNRPRLTTTTTSDLPLSEIPKLWGTFASGLEDPPATTPNYSEKFWDYFKWKLNQPTTTENFGTEGTTLVPQMEDLSPHLRPFLVTPGGEMATAPSTVMESRSFELGANTSQEEPEPKNPEIAKFESNRLSPGPKNLENSTPGTPNETRHVIYETNPFLKPLLQETDNKLLGTKKAKYTILVRNHVKEDEKPVENSTTGETLEETSTEFTPSLQFHEKEENYMDFRVLKPPKVEFQEIGYADYLTGPFRSAYRRPGTHQKSYDRGKEMENGKIVMGRGRKVPFHATHKRPVVPVSNFPGVNYNFNKNNNNDNGNRRKGLPPTRILPPAYNSRSRYGDYMDALRKSQEFIYKNYPIGIGYPVFGGRRRRDLAGNPGNYANRERRWNSRDGRRKIKDKKFRNPSGKIAPTASDRSGEKAEMNREIYRESEPAREYHRDVASNEPLSALEKVQPDAPGTGSAISSSNLETIGPREIGTLRGGGNERVKRNHDHLQEVPEVVDEVIDKEIATRFEHEDEDEPEDDPRGKKVEVEVPEFDYDKNEREIVEKSNLETATKTRTRIDHEKYPFYRRDSLPNPSALRYVTNPRKVPRKTFGGMEFYESRDEYLDCEEVEPDLDAILAKKEAEVRSEEEGTEEGGKGDKKPHLSGLGDKLDCYKAKYFDRNPLDNPLFAEEKVEDPSVPEELRNPWKLTSRVMNLPPEREEYSRPRISRKPEPGFEGSSSGSLPNSRRSNPIGVNSGPRSNFGSYSDSRRTKNDNSAKSVGVNYAPRSNSGSHSNSRTKNGTFVKPIGVNFVPKVFRPRRGNVPLQIVRSSTKDPTRKLQRILKIQKRLKNNRPRAVFLTTTTTEVPSTTPMERQIYDDVMGTIQNLASSESENREIPVQVTTYRPSTGSIPYQDALTSHKGLNSITSDMREKETGLPLIDITENSRILGNIQGLLPPPVYRNRQRFRNQVIPLESIAYLVKRPHEVFRRSLDTREIIRLRRRGRGRKGDVGDDESKKGEVLESSKKVYTILDRAKNSKPRDLESGKFGKFLENGGNDNEADSRRNEPRYGSRLDSRTPGNRRTRVRSGKDNADSVKKESRLQEKVSPGENPVGRGNSDVDDVSAKEKVSRDYHVHEEVQEDVVTPATFDLPSPRVEKLVDSKSSEESAEKPSKEGSEEEEGGPSGEKYTQGESESSESGEKSGEKGIKKDEPFHWFDSRPWSPPESFDDPKYADLGPRISKPAFYHPPFEASDYESRRFRESAESRGSEESESADRSGYLFPWEKEKQEAKKGYEYPWEKRERLRKERERDRFLRGSYESEEEEGESRSRPRYEFPWERYHVSEAYLRERDRKLEDNEEETSELRPKYSSRYSWGEIGAFDGVRSKPPGSFNSDTAASKIRESVVKYEKKKKPKGEKIEVKKPEFEKIEEKKPEFEKIEEKKQPEGKKIEAEKSSKTTKMAVISTGASSNSKEGKQLGLKSGPIGAIVTKNDGRKNSTRIGRRRQRKPDQPAIVGPRTSTATAVAVAKPISRRRLKKNEEKETTTIKPRDVRARVQRKLGATPTTIRPRGSNDKRKKVSRRKSSSDRRTLEKMDSGDEKNSTSPSSRTVEHRSRVSKEEIVTRIFYPTEHDDNDDETEKMQKNANEKTIEDDKEPDKQEHVEKVSILTKETPEHIFETKEIDKNGVKEKYLTIKANDNNNNRNGSKIVDEEEGSKKVEEDAKKEVGVEGISSPSESYLIANPLRHGRFSASDRNGSRDNPRNGRNRSGKAYRDSFTLESEEDEFDEEGTEEEDEDSKEQQQDNVETLTKIIKDPTKRNYYYVERR